MSVPGERLRAAYRTSVSRGRYRTRTGLTPHIIDHLTSRITVLVAIGGVEFKQRNKCHKAADNTGLLSRTKISTEFLSLSANDSKSAMH